MILGGCGASGPTRAGGAAIFTPDVRKNGGSGTEVCSLLRDRPIGYSVKLENGCMLITLDERIKVKQIIKAGKASDEVALWLCGLIQRLARIKPTEEDFPKMAAVINPVACTAYACEFEERVPVEQETPIHEFGRSGPWWILDQTVECSVTQVMLFIRPYIRVVKAPKGDDVLGRLARHARVLIEVDGVALVTNGPAEEHLVGPDGYGLFRKPFAFQVKEPSTRGGIYLVGILDEETQLATPGGAGCFVTNDTKIRIALSGVDLKANEEIVLSTGLVMGLYTTKPVGGATFPDGMKKD